MTAVTAALVDLERARARSALFQRSRAVRLARRKVHASRKGMLVVA